MEQLHEEEGEEGARDPTGMAADVLNEQDFIHRACWVCWHH